MNRLHAKAILGISVLAVLIVAAPAQATTYPEPALSVGTPTLNASATTVIIPLSTTSPDWSLTGGTCQGAVFTEPGTSGYPWTETPFPEDANGVPDANGILRVSPIAAGSTPIASVYSISLTCPVDGKTITVRQPTAVFPGNQPAARIVTFYRPDGGCNFHARANGDLNTRCVGARAQITYHFSFPTTSPWPPLGGVTGTWSYALTRITHSVLAGIHGCRNSGWVISQNDTTGRYTAMFHQASKGTHISQCDIVSVKFHYTETITPNPNKAGANWPSQ